MTVYNYLLLVVPVLGVVAIVAALRRQDATRKPHAGE